MIFKVNNLQISPSNLWYHYKDIPDASDFFEVKISKNESELIQLIEDYCRCKIDTLNIIERIINLDSSKRSYGLIWHILNHAKKRNTELNVYDWEWVLNNIKEIEINNDFVIIKGMATKYNENSG